jgi:ParB family chromosome partitioning protein
MSDDLLRHKRPSGLGRGLSALLGEASREEPINGGGVHGAGVQPIPIALIRPHPGQPRRFFDEEALDELARSIGVRGLIQPIIVRPHDGGYQIVAGERRWRAAQRAQLHDIPAIVRDFSEAETLEVALVENIQRQDLNAIEEAEAYSRLIADYGHSQEALARLVHKSRSHVANLIRLLELPAPVRMSVAEGRLTMGHARALITAPDPAGLAEQVIRDGLSVRETEKLARGVRPTARRQGKLEYKGGNADVEALERQLGDLLGLKVQIKHGPSGGSVTVSYSSLEQLDMICQRLSGEPI